MLLTVWRSADCKSNTCAVAAFCATSYLTQFNRWLVNLDAMQSKALGTSFQLHLSGTECNLTYKHKSTWITEAQCGRGHKTVLYLGRDLSGVCAAIIKGSTLARTLGKGRPWIWPSPASPLLFSNENHNSLFPGAWIMWHWKYPVL